MKTKKQPLVVNPASPFEGDALSREKACTDLADFIVQAETPYVLAVDAPWGAGKTVFLQMLEAVCKQRGIPTVFFNAWEADFHNDALAAMVGEIEIPHEKELGEKFAEAATTLKRTLMSRDFYTAAANVAAAATGAELALKAANVTAQAANLGKLLRPMEELKAVADYRQQRQAIANFKRELKNFAWDPDKGKGKPLVFFVDELDRCRPVFAVEVLEKIKHIFDAEGVFFVVAVNKGELAKTVQSVYGGIDADIYLRKFFDHEHWLVNRSGFIASVLQELGFAEHLRRYLPSFNPSDEIKRIVALCDAYGFSLRDCEQVAQVFASAMMNTDHQQVVPPDITGFFAAMFVADQQQFRKYQAAVDGMNGTHDELPRFPFMELAGDYKEVAGCDFEKPDNQATKKDRLFRRTYEWCCANRYLVDSEYRQQVDRDLSDHGPHSRFFLRVRGWAEKQEGGSPHPKWVIDSVARIGSPRFNDGKAE